MQYPKINTLWKREYSGKNKGCIIPGEYSEPEFESINKWTVTEKIDGTNTRIIFERIVVEDVVEDIVVPTLRFAGRTDKAEMLPQLKGVLENYFKKDMFEEIFPDASNVILFGEGFGKKIQEPHGKMYIPDGNDFILFDVWVDGWWLERDSVKDIADKFGIKTVPFLGIKTIDEIVELVQKKELSLVSTTPQIVEGYVCTSYPMMRYRFHNRPIRFKLKVSDYERYNNVK